jgi:hypothetical protein
MIPIRFSTQAANPPRQAKRRFIYARKKNTKSSFARTGEFPLRLLGKKEEAEEGGKKTFCSEDIC